MGIKNGAPNIISIISNGLYHRHAKHYKINIDGELMRYKGMIEVNLCKHNAEEAIATTSFDYMKNLIDTLETFIGYRAQEVIVYMDGIRVLNKESNRSDFHFDAGLIRLSFKNLCFQYGYTINELDHGESELQMYLQRDQTVDLNIFLTNDSDMISICYGHEPTLYSHTPIFDSEGKEICVDFSILPDSFINNVIEKQAPKVISAKDPTVGFNPVDSAAQIIDINSVYNANILRVRDSCVWMNCGKNLTAIGFDFIQNRIYFTPHTFRTFIAFCGTDFTGNLLTDSMISGILLSKKSDIEFINTLVDINEIGACLLVLGLRAGGTLKRFEARHRNEPFDPHQINTFVRMYLDYISTGKMLIEQPQRPCMNMVSRQYIFAMRKQSLVFTKGQLVMWAKSIALSEAIVNLNENMGLYDALSMTDEKGQRKRSTKTVQLCTFNKKLAIEMSMKPKFDLYNYHDDTSGNSDNDNDNNTSSCSNRKQSKSLKLLETDNVNKNENNNNNNSISNEEPNNTNNTTESSLLFPYSTYQYGSNNIMNIL